MFPEPDCTHGYSHALLKENMGVEGFSDLMRFMHGQTMMLCDGTNHPAHGPVVYTGDVRRFLNGGWIYD